MKAKIQKWGNSLALRIPKSFALEVGLQEDANVELTLDAGQLHIMPLPESPMTLEEMMAKVNEGNLHHEVDSGSAVGQEIW